MAIVSSNTFLTDDRGVPPLVKAALPFWHADAAALDPEGAAWLTQLWQDLDATSQDWQRAAGIDVVSNFSRIDGELKKLFRGAARSTSWTARWKKPDPTQANQDLAQLQLAKTTWADQAKTKVELLSSGLARQQTNHASLQPAATLVHNWETLALARLEAIDTQMAQSESSETLMALDAERSALTRLQQACVLINARLEKESSQGAAFREMFTAALHKEKLALQHMDSVLQDGVEQVSAALVLIASERAQVTVKALPPPQKALAVTGFKAGGDSAMGKWMSLLGGNKLSRDMREIVEMLQEAEWPPAQETRFMNNLVAMKAEHDTPIPFPNGTKTVFQVMFERNLICGGLHLDKEKRFVRDLITQAHQKGNLRAIMATIPEIDRVARYKAALISRHGYHHGHLAGIAQEDMPVEFAVYAWNHIIDKNKTERLGDSDKAILSHAAGVAWAEGTRHQMQFPAKGISVYQQETIETLCQSAHVPTDLRLHWIGKAWAEFDHSVKTPHHLTRGLRWVFNQGGPAKQTELSRAVLGFITRNQPERQLSAIQQELDSGHMRGLLHDWVATVQGAMGALVPKSSTLKTLIDLKAYGILESRVRKAEDWDDYQTCKIWPNNYQPLCHLLLQDAPAPLFSVVADRLHRYVDIVDEQGQTPMTLAVHHKKWAELETLTKLGASLVWSGDNIFTHLSRTLDPQEALDISVRVGKSMLQFPVAQISEALNRTLPEIALAIEASAPSGQRREVVRNFLEGLPSETSEADFIEMAHKMAHSPSIEVARDVMKARNLFGESAAAAWPALDQRMVHAQLLEKRKTEEDKHAFEMKKMAEVELMQQIFRKFS